jgi:hypothetical protein
MPSTFTENLTALMPEGVTLAPELVTTFNWMEEQGWHHTRGEGAPEEHYLSIYPAEVFNEPNASIVVFGGTTLAYTGHWSTPDPAVDARIAEIAGTSGDGGRAAIWLDGAGKQWFVHLGHDTLGVISDDPVVLLQWLSMGYGEPGSLEATDITPEQQMLEFNGYDDISEVFDDERIIVPTEFQAFLKAEFGVTPPATARDLGIADFAVYGDETSKDPFVQWMIKVTPPPTAEELAYIEELTKMAENMNFDDLEHGLDETPEGKSFLDKAKGFFGLGKK